MFLIFDVETTGLPKDYKKPYTDTNNWPRLVQLAWKLCDRDGKTIEIGKYIIKPNGFMIPKEAIKIHDIDNAIAMKDGFPLPSVIGGFQSALSKADFLVGHNLSYDFNVVASEMHRLHMVDSLKLLSSKKQICIMKISKDYCRLPSERGYKYPTLEELVYFLFEKRPVKLHEAGIDVEVTAMCFFEFLKRGVIKISSK